jgi:serine/threonine-protein kinase
MTLLEKEPDERFADATVLVQALDGQVAVSPPRGATAAPVAPEMQPPLPSAPPATAAQMPDQWERWHAPLVLRFRRRFIPYAFVNSVIVLAAIFTGVNLLGVTVIWSIILAFQYSKLWSAGYDWRDVFRQPRDRLLADVAGETVDEVRAVFDRDRREDRRQRRAQQRARHRALAAPPPPPAPGNPNPSFTPPTAGPHHGTVQRAAEDLNAIHGLVRSLPKRDQRLVQDMVPAADALYQRIHSLARSLAELERAATPEAAERLEAEIASLEAQANPNDRSSESRVRRLALLKRERRALADSAKRREEMTGKLESCRIALENMRVDVVRLRAGGVASATQNITLLTDRARSLADSVDAAVAGADGFAAGARERRPERGRA